MPFTIVLEIEKEVSLGMRDYNLDFLLILTSIIEKCNA
jgi:hypothetical protein